MGGSSVSELEMLLVSVHHFVEVFQGLSIVMIAEEIGADEVRCCQRESRMQGVKSGKATLLSHRPCELSRP